MEKEYKKYILNGMRVVTNDSFFTVGRVQKRTHKKKRINKKWRKKYGYVDKISYTVLIHNNTIYCHSKTLERIMNS